MTLDGGGERLSDRRALLEKLDRLRRDVDASGMIAGLDAFETRVFDLILGNAASAFGVKKEPKAVHDRHGRRLGKYLLTARHLCEAGCGFVTVNYGGWDMHGRIKRGPRLDQAVSAFLEDVQQRGLSEKTRSSSRATSVPRRPSTAAWAAITEPL